MKYAVIIPAKNESLTIGDVIDAIATQTVPPLAIILMDDGSTDDTLSIVRGRQEKYPILECYSLEPSGEYSLGGHVACLFNRGVRILKQRNLEFDWIVKLDADLKFDADFIEKIANRIATKKIGIASGTPYYFEGKHKFYEYSPVWHTHGQFKIYSRQCYETIGGIPESLGWDTADNIIAITNGWETIAFSDINYMMHRKVGGKSSLTRGRINHGIGCFVLGYDTVYLSLKNRA
ncbi:MAG: glycosyltransferase [Gammaproteobacteria bacterium]|nr:glycosyltransferase [Gammaproteobacteria bacterium]